MKNGIIDVARKFSDREGEVRSGISHYGDLVMQFGTLIQEARFRDESELKWNSITTVVETIQYHITTLHELGAITDYDFERGKRKVGKLMDYAQIKDSDSLEFSARDMWSYMKDIRDSLVPYCLNPKAVAKKRQVVD